jgi:hypothetical protein
MDQEMMEMETVDVENLQSMVKILLLKDRDEYLIGTVTELDEEPAILIEKCYRILECGEYGDNLEELVQRAKSRGDHLLISQEEETFKEKTSWSYEYVILEKYPKYCSQRDLFLTSDSLLTILDPEQGVLDLYEKISG